MKWTLLFGSITILLLHHASASNNKRSYDYTVDYDINTVPGIAGKDYPALAEVPPNDFYCEGKMAGYYADPYFGCQVYHKCDIDHRKDSFLCSNGTVFNQKTFVCEWWYSVDCSQSIYYYSLNARLYKTSYQTSPSLYKDSRGIVYVQTASVPSTIPKPELSSSSYAKPTGDLLFATFFKDVQHLTAQADSSSEEQSYSSPAYSQELIASSIKPPTSPLGQEYGSDEEYAGQSIEDNSAPVQNSNSVPIKMYKAKKVAKDGKVKVESMEESKESHESHDD